jgi:hypothetical protein
MSSDFSLFCYSLLRIVQTSLTYYQLSKLPNYLNCFALIVSPLKTIIPLV